MTGTGSSASRQRGAEDEGELEKEVQELVGMGFDRHKAIWALKNNAGDFDAALGFLAAGGDCGGGERADRLEEPAGRDDDQEQSKRLKGAKAKREKKAAKEAGAAGGGGGDGGGGEGGSHVCNVCKATFPSR